MAVLATMILFSYAKFFDVIHTSASLLYGQPAYGSCNINVEQLPKLTVGSELLHDTRLNAATYIYFLLIFVLLFFSCVSFLLFLSSLGSGFYDVKTRSFLSG